MKRNFYRAFSLLIAALLAFSAMAVSAIAEGDKTSTVYIEVFQDFGDLSPWGQNQDPFMSTRLNFYETLFENRPDGTQVPLLIESYEFAEDGITMNVKLHEGIVDHMGNEITTSDVLFSFSKALEGAEYSRHAKNINFDESYVIDDYNMVLVLKQPSAFIYNDMTRISIVSQATYEACEDGMVNFAYGSGPYKMVSYTPGYELVLEKNDNYWNAGSEVSQRQNVDRVVYRVISEETQRTIELETGSVDLLLNTPTIDIEYLQAEAGYEVYAYSGPNVTPLYYNCESSPFTDENLRHAVSCAIDNVGINNAVYNGLYRPADSLAAPIVPAYSENSLLYSYDVEKAKEYLAASNYDGRTLRMMITSNLQPIAEIIQNNLAAIGISVQIDVYDSATYNTLISDRTAWDCMISGYSNIGSFLFTLYNQFNDNTTNRVGWHDEEFQALLAEASKTGDAEQEAQLLQMMNEADVVHPLYYTQVYFAYRTDMIEAIEVKSDNWVLPGDITYNYDCEALYD